MQAASTWRLRRRRLLGGIPLHVMWFGAPTMSWRKLPDVPNWRQALVRGPAQVTCPLILPFGEDRKRQRKHLLGQVDLVRELGLADVPRGDGLLFGCRRQSSSLSATGCHVAQQNWRFCTLTEYRR